LTMRTATLMWRSRGPEHVVGTLRADADFLAW
jgi:hypothetical protein